MIICRISKAKSFISYITSIQYIHAGGHPHTRFCLHEPEALAEVHEENDEE